MAINQMAIFIINSMCTLREFLHLFVHNVWLVIRFSEFAYVGKFYTEVLPLIEFELDSNDITDLAEATTLIVNSEFY